MLRLDVAYYCLINIHFLVPHATLTHALPWEEYISQTKNTELCYMAFL